MSRGNTQKSREAGGKVDDGGTAEVWCLNFKKKKTYWDFNISQLAN